MHAYVVVQDPVCHCFAGMAGVIVRGPTSTPDISCTVLSSGVGGHAIREAKCVLQGHNNAIASQMGKGSHQLDFAESVQDIRVG